MKAVILTNDQPNQAALVQRLLNIVEVGAVIVSHNIPRKKPSMARRTRLLLNSAAGRMVGLEFVDTWRRLLDHYARSTSRIDSIVSRFEVKNVNDQITIDAIDANSPCLVIVSGTNLVGRQIIDAANRGYGIVNLHTGISPYVKGGPNCTNWCLALGWFHLIGNTVMWLDSGIDSGNIISTERTQLDGSESLFDLHLKVMEHAHELYCRVTARIASGLAVPSVPQQNIGVGANFFSVDWGFHAMKNAKANLQQCYRDFFSDAEAQERLNSQIRLISLDDV